MLFILTTAGQALIDASPSSPVICTGFRVSQTTPYIPSAGQTSANGAMLFSGMPSQPVQQSNGSVMYAMYMDSSVGNFFFNEVTLWVGTTLFAVACASTDIEKKKTTNVLNGNNLTITGYVTSGNTNAIIGTSNSSVEYNVASVSVPDLLPQAGSSDINIYQTGLSNTSGELTLAHKIGQRWEVSGFATSGPISISAGGANYVQFATRQRVVPGAGLMLVQALSGANAGYVRTVSTYVDSTIRYNLANAFPNALEANAIVEVMWYNKIDDVTPVFGTGTPVVGTTVTSSGYYIDTSADVPTEYAYNKVTNQWVRLGRTKTVEAGIYRNRVALVGAHGYRSRATSNTSAVNQDSVFAWTNAMLKNSMTVTGVVGDTETVLLDDIISTHLPAALATDCDFVDIAIGFGDLYTTLATSSVMLVKVNQIIDTVVAAAKVPLINNVRARSFVNNTILSEHLKFNAGLKDLVAIKNQTLLIDTFRVNVDMEDVDGNAYTTFTTDGVKLSPKGARYIARAKARQLRRVITENQDAAVSAAETFARTGANNVVINTAMVGTAGTLWSNVVGSAPTGWKVEWKTRTGTGVGRARIVEVTDDVTGLVTSYGVSLTVDSGIPADGDCLRIVQDSGLNTNIQGGLYVQGEGRVELYAGYGVKKIEFVVSANGNVSSWGATANGTTVYEGDETFYAGTLPTLVSGSGASASAVIGVEMTFSGASTGSIVASGIRARLSASNPFVNA